MCKTYWYNRRATHWYKRRVLSGCQLSTCTVGSMQTNKSLGHFLDTFLSKTNVTKGQVDQSYQRALSKPSTRVGINCWCSPNLKFYSSCKVQEFFNIYNITIPSCSTRSSKSHFNPSPKDKMLDLSKFKAFQVLPGLKSTCTWKWKAVLKSPSKKKLAMKSPRKLTSDTEKSLNFSFSRIHVSWNQHKGQMWTF